MCSRSIPRFITLNLVSTLKYNKNHNYKQRQKAKMKYTELKFQFYDILKLNNIKKYAEKNI